MNKAFAPLLLAAAITVSLTPSKGAVTVHVSAGLGEPALTLSGTPLPNGNHVRIGTLASTFDPGNDADDLALLDTAWSPFGETETLTVLTELGRLGGQLVHTDPQFDGKKIYWWAFKTTNNDAPDATYSNVAAHGLFSSSSASWQFPTEGSALASTITSSSDIDQAFHGSLSVGALALEAIPEPSTTTLLLLGCLALLRRGRQGRQTERWHL